MNDKDSKESVTEGETLEEEEEEEEGRVEIEEQSGNESEINEPEEEVSSFLPLISMAAILHNCFENCTGRIQFLVQKWLEISTFSHTWEEIPFYLWELPNRCFVLHSWNSLPSSLFWRLGHYGFRQEMGLLVRIIVGRLRVEVAPMVLWRLSHMQGRVILRDTLHGSDHLVDRMGAGKRGAWGFPPCLLCWELKQLHSGSPHRSDLLGKAEEEERRACVQCRLSWLVTRVQLPFSSQGCFRKTTKCSSRHASLSEGWQFWRPQERKLDLAKWIPRHLCLVIRNWCGCQVRRSWV